MQNFSKIERKTLDVAVAVLARQQMLRNKVGIASGTTVKHVKRKIVFHKLY